MITIDNLTHPAGPGLEEAKAWFSALRPHPTGVSLPGWHADDGFEGSDGVDADATRKINRIVAEMRRDAGTWPDPDVLYRLCAGQRVAAEDMWPGFVADVESYASRLGYVSLPGRTLPNFVIEDFAGEFYLLEFDVIGPMSRCPSFSLSRLRDISFNPEGGEPYVLTGEARIVPDSAVRFDDLGMLSAMLTRVHEDTRPPSPGERP